MRQIDSVRRSPRFNSVLEEAAAEVAHKMAIAPATRTPQGAAAALEGAVTRDFMPEIVESVATGAAPPRGAEIPSMAVEAIVLDRLRPPYLIVQDRIRIEGDFDHADLVTARQDLLNQRARSVGRVDLMHHPRLDFAGTGWLIEKDIAVTNRHVAQEFAEADRLGRFCFRRGADDQEMAAVLDFIRQHQTLGLTRRALVTEVLFIAGLEEPDFAFLRVQPIDALEPMPLSARPVALDEVVAAIGYPARDIRNDAAVMAEVFQNIYNVKRFSPGLVTGFDAETGAFMTDYSTLGGNSGSAVIALDSGEVVGLHFAGLFHHANYAVPSSLVAAALRRLRTQVAVAAEAPRPDPVSEPEAFADRDGYDPDFLGKDRPVPLPGPGRWADDIAPVEGADDGVLRYRHFSVLQCRSRRLPLVTAVNINGEAQRMLKREGEWRLDGRIARDHQIGGALYVDNPLDRGHMVRRRDPGWGDPDEARQAEADTFHYTNAAPQHEGLNQQTWLGLEDYILGAAQTRGFRASVLTGPVFRDDDPRLRSRPDDAEDVPIPREFWKIAAMIHADTGELHATGYVLSHGALIRDITEAAFVFGRYATYQVPIARIAQATGLDFGALSAADPLGGDAESPVQAIEIHGPESIRF